MNKKFIFIIIVIMIVSSIIYMKFNSKNNEYENILYEEVENNIETEEIIEEKIKIHICGEVKNPGLIEMFVGSRIDDAIEMAGGITEQADISKINLAYILSDGEKIYIPNVNDKDIESGSNLFQNAKININTATIEELQTLDGVGQSTAEAIISYREDNGRFTSIEDLKNVSGIGESKFQKIKEKICVK